MKKVIKSFLFFFTAVFALLSLSSCEFDLQSIFSDNSALQSLVESYQNEYVPNESGFLSTEAVFYGEKSTAIDSDKTLNVDTTMTLSTDGTYTVVNEFSYTSATSTDYSAGNSTTTAVGTYFIDETVMTIEVTSVNDVLVDYSPTYFTYYGVAIYLDGMLLHRDGYDFSSQTHTLMGYQFVISVAKDDTTAVFTGDATSKGKYFEIYYDGTFDKVDNKINYQYISSEMISGFDTSEVGAVKVTVVVSGITYKAMMIVS